MFDRPEKLYNLANAQKNEQQVLTRRLEPDMGMNSPDQVISYAQTCLTNISIYNALAFSIIDKLIPHKNRENAIDLCCGPGHFARGLIQQLKFNTVVGFDISKPMVEMAYDNAIDDGLAHCLDFKVADIRFRENHLNSKADLVTLINSAHHLSSTMELSSAIEHAVSYLKPGGIFLLIDVGRLKTASITEKFVNIVGSEYQDKGLFRLRADFCNSMYAAWLPEEIKAAIPAHCAPMNWYQQVSAGLPVAQLLLAADFDLAAGTYAQRDFNVNDLLISEQAKFDWAFMKQLSYIAKFARSLPENKHLGQNRGFSRK